ncbi:hypothetical protein Cabys_645 [Caldithrix abyssi DSM 13497]|uniref:Uncharacterized protein n=1 Tax=Caldithrix abyssi DSM 13497 TaxID=880073 RepID=A0A1J1C4Q6_CALAY|nr:hypothetical protein Cabys_645 [Caldithrix abyssi DSM 13497]
MADGRFFPTVFRVSGTGNKREKIILSFRGFPVIHSTDLSIKKDADSHHFSIG